MSPHRRVDRDEAARRAEPWVQIAPNVTRKAGGTVETRQSDYAILGEIREKQALVPVPVWVSVDEKALTVW